jgi:hypothetical protein
LARDIKSKKHKTNGCKTRAGHIRSPKWLPSFYCSTVFPFTAIIKVAASQLVKTPISNAKNWQKLEVLRTKSPHKAFF